MKKFRFGTWLVLSAGSLLLLSQALPAENAAANQKNQIKVQLLNHSDETAIGTLELNGEYQLKLGKKDKYGRATAAHVQMQEQHKAKKKKETKVTYNPIGWHNYKFYYGNGDDRAWLMNRAHLIGFTFSGLNNEGKNLVPMTAWLNSGSFQGLDDNNPDSMNTAWSAGWRKIQITGWITRLLRFTRTMSFFLARLSSSMSGLTQKAMLSASS